MRGRGGRAGGKGEGSCHGYIEVRTRKTPEGKKTKARERRRNMMKTQLRHKGQETGKRASSQTANRGGYKERNNSAAGLIMGLLGGWGGGRGRGGVRMRGEGRGDTRP